MATRRKLQTYHDACKWIAENPDTDRTGQEQIGYFLAQTADATTIAGYQTVALVAEVFGVDRAVVAAAVAERRAQIIGVYRQVELTQERRAKWREAARKRREYIAYLTQRLAPARR